ncbi:MAG: DUF1329 domain-containing protein [Candidatus Binatia bacterium]
MKKVAKVMSAALASALIVLAPSGTVQGKGLQPGDVLSKENWQLAKGLLPPEILAHYKNGEYRNPILRWEDGQYRWSQAFLKATQRNAQQLTLGKMGDIVDRASGKRPAYVSGFPFPNVTADDPEAGIKILWNHYFYWWNNGNVHNYVKISWVSPRGLDRSATQDVYFVYYQGQPRQYIPRKNPDDLLTQLLARTVDPADLNGTTALTWRYREPTKRDSAWAYVPALRRVRAVSPTNRSDGFLGSDLSQDDGPFFDGKPEDFIWKLSGERDFLRLVDPYSLKGDYKRVPAPGGGWRGIFKKVPMVGFQDPGWKGSPWAPVSFGLARRRCWVIEGTPKDKYYLYKKIQLSIDKETYQGAYNRKFDWQGELLNTYTVVASLTGDTNNNGDYYGNGSVVYQVAENVKLDRATVVIPPLENGDPPNDRRIRLDPQLFVAQALLRFGK